MKIFAYFVVCLFVFTENLFAKVHPEKIAKSLVDQYVAGWLSYDGQAFADVFEDDAEFVNIFGMQLSGKKQIALRHQAIFDSFLSKTVFSPESVTAKYIREDIILAHVKWRLSNLQMKPCQDNKKENSLRCPRYGIFNHVILKQSDNNWKIIETQNTLILPPNKRS